MQQTIAMTGASGMLGTPIIKALMKRGFKLKILSSSDASAARLKMLGDHEIVRGDFRESNDLARLLSGVDAVLHIPPSVVEDEDQIGLSMIAAAKGAGTKHFMFMSCFHSIIPELRHHVNKLRVEQALLTSGLNYSILQPSMFMQNLGFIWAKVKTSGVFEWPWDPKQQYSMIDVNDIADATAHIFASPHLHGATYELCSNDTLTGVQMAAFLAEALGRDVRAGQQDADDWRSGMAKSGASAWSVETVMGMCTYHDRHGYHGGSAFVLEAILGRKAGTYRQFAHRWVSERGA